MPASIGRSASGSPATDAPLADGWLLDWLGSGFHLLGIGTEVPETLRIDGIDIAGVSIPAASAGQELKARYLGDAASAVYLIRPDQHVAARWTGYDRAAVENALAIALGKGGEA